VDRELGELWYLRHKKKARVWMPMCQQEPQNEKGRFFKREWLLFYQKAVKPGKFQPIDSRTRARPTAHRQIGSVGVLHHTGKNVFC